MAELTRKPMTGHSGAVSDIWFCVCRAREWRCFFFFFYVNEFHPHRNAVICGEGWNFLTLCKCDKGSTFLWDKNSAFTVHWVDLEEVSLCCLFNLHAAIKGQRRRMLSGGSGSCRCWPACYQDKISQTCQATALSAFLSAGVHRHPSPVTWLPARHESRLAKGSEAFPVRIVTHS